MSDLEKKEKEVFEQEVNADELEGVAGGEGARYDSNCYQEFNRDLFNEDGSVNCAATVEEGSRCWSNDACNANAVYYWFPHDCKYVDCIRPFEPKK